MNRDFTLATELTEEGVGGDWRVAGPATGATSATGAGVGPNLQAATNGGLGLLIACLALWAVWWMFPGNQRNARSDTTQTSPPSAWPAAPAAQSPAKPQPDAIKVELGANGIVIRRREASAASAPASGAAKATRKAAPPATQAAHDSAAGPASAPYPTR